MTKNRAQSFFHSGLNLVSDWQLAAEWDDGYQLLDGLEIVANKLGKKAQAQLHVQRGRLLIDDGMFRQRDTTEARTAELEQALSIATALGDVRLLGNVYDAMGFSLHAVYLQGDRSQELADEIKFFERGLQLRQEANDLQGIAESTFHIGIVHDVVRRDYEVAQSFHQQAYDLAVSAENPLIASYAIRHLGFCHYRLGRLDEALVALEESLQLRQQIGFVPGTAYALIALAIINADNDPASSLAQLQEARTILESFGAPIERVDNLITTVSAKK